MLREKPVSHVRYTYFPCGIFSSDRTFLHPLPTCSNSDELNRTVFLNISICYGFDVKAKVRRLVDWSPALMLPGGDETFGRQGLQSWGCVSFPSAHQEMNSFPLQPVFCHEALLHNRPTNWPQTEASETVSLNKPWYSKYLKYFVMAAEDWDEGAAF